MWLTRGRFAMVTGNSAALMPRPQSVAVQLPHPLRTVTRATDATDDQMTPRAYLVFTLKVVASAVVGAAATILLWSAVQRPAFDPSQLEQVASRDEATVYRVAR